MNLSYRVLVFFLLITLAACEESCPPNTEAVTPNSNISPMNNCTPMKDDTTGYFRNGEPTCVTYSGKCINDGKTCCRPKCDETLDYSYSCIPRPDGKTHCEVEGKGKCVDAPSAGNGKTCCRHPCPTDKGCKCDRVRNFEGCADGKKCEVMDDAGKTISKDGTCLHDPLPTRAEKWYCCVEQKEEPKPAS
ncbi:hypothetical protein DdX_19221 [Ditylenchus destructor]|uniref:Uncharacterized protein n=1 Tax=Ditylenchus destructor TaxID=166010 RepID=A0AAD4MJR6_9BILA|nr:hypothetical protein DdX_19221 [Ditylenchus destructor]